MRVRGLFRHSKQNTPEGVCFQTSGCGLLIGGKQGIQKHMLFLPLPPSPPLPLYLAGLLS